MILKQLYIKNLATISELRFDFSPNLNLITGETGAGKSILVDALKILSGKKVDLDLIRFGEKYLIVEGIFEDLTDEVKKILKEKELESLKDFLILRREIYKDKPQRVYINDSVVNLKTLTEIGNIIISIFGQEEEKSFEEEELSLKFLDLYSNIDNTEISFLYDLIRENEKDLRELLDLKNRSDKMRENLTFSIQEIEKANLKEREEEELQKQKYQLKKKEEILNALNFFLKTVDSEDGSIIKKLKESEKLFENLSKNISFCEEILKCLKNSREGLEEAFFIATKEASQFQDPVYSLDEIESRLAFIENLKKKYGNTVEEIINYKEKLRKELENIIDIDEKIKEAEDKLNKNKNKYKELAIVLSDKRFKNSKTFKEKINKLFPKLNLKNAKFDVEIIYNKDLFTPNGRDKVCFKVQTNIGESMLPIEKIASGGELSRIHLAIQEVIQARKGKVLVFDEVDQGIGGRTAFSVGKILKNLGKKDQVLCVSHLPQVAIWADNHIKVIKIVEGNRTITKIENLKDKERVQEIARMLGGEEFESAIEHAKKLIESTGEKD